MLTLTENASTIVRDITAQIHEGQSPPRLPTPDSASPPTTRPSRRSRSAPPRARSPVTRRWSRTERPSTSTASPPRSSTTRCSTPASTRPATSSSRWASRPDDTERHIRRKGGRDQVRPPFGVLSGSRMNHDPRDPPGLPPLRLAGARELPHRDRRAPRARSGPGPGPQHRDVGRPLHARPDERREVLRRRRSRSTPRWAAAPSARSSPVAATRSRSATPWSTSSAGASTRCSTTGRRPRRRHGDRAGLGVPRRARHARA